MHGDELGALITVAPTKPRCNGDIEGLFNNSLEVVLVFLAVHNTFIKK